jgi:hypothetical protein
VDGERSTRAVPVEGQAGQARPCQAGVTVRSDHGRLEIAAQGGADRRSAKNAAAPINQSRAAHHSARPLHSPRGL